MSTRGYGVFNKIRVLLVAAHVEDGLAYKTCLSSSDRIGAIFDVDSCDAAGQLYTSLAPDVMIVDLSTAERGNLENVRRLLIRYPDCKILALNIYDDLLYVIRAIKAGAKGYIIKTSAPETLLSAVCSIVEGDTFIDPCIAHQLAEGVGRDVMANIKTPDCSLASYRLPDRNTAQAVGNYSRCE